MSKQEGRCHYLQMKYFSLCMCATLLCLAPVNGTPGLRREQADASKNNKAKPKDRELKGDLFNRFLMIVLENKDYDNVVNDSYFQYLITQGTLFSNFNAVARPSYPNYVAMVAGSTFGINSNDQRVIQEMCIVNLLEKKGLAWKTYAEGYPGNCNLKNEDGAYARRHVPLLSFSSIQDDPQRCKNIVPADEFNNDWNNHFPSYSMYIPDNNNNGHDTGLGHASNWLESFLTPILEDSARMDGTLIQIVFDEPSKGDDSLHIFNLFIGPMVKKDFVVDTSYNFYDVLRTVEGNWNIGTLGQEDSSATSIGGIWV